MRIFISESILLIELFRKHPWHAVEEKKIYSRWLSRTSFINALRRSQSAEITIQRGKKSRLSFDKHSLFVVVVVVVPLV